MNRKKPRTINTYDQSPLSSMLSNMTAKRTEPVEGLTLEELRMQLETWKAEETRLAKLVVNERLETARLTIKQEGLMKENARLRTAINNAKDKS